jgi:hypothetical protein
MADFGRDVSCLPDGLRTGRIVTGNRLLLESIARKLCTRAGQCPGAPKWGVFLPDMIGATFRDSDIASLCFRVRATLCEDERIVDANVEATLDDARIVLHIDVVTADGPFALVLAVSDLSVSILETS